MSTKPLPDAAEQESAAGRQIRLRPGAKSATKPKNQSRKGKTTPSQALKDSELRYRRLFEAAQDGILILNAQTGTIDDVNPYLIDMLGYSRPELVKKKLWEVGAFKDVDASKIAFNVLQEKGYIRYENLPLMTKSGQLIQVEFVSNVYLADGKLVIQCNIHDITERKRVDEMRAKSAAIVGNSDDAIIGKTLDGIITSWNSGAQRLYGYSAEEVLGRSISLLAPSDRPNELPEILSRLSRGERVEHYETIRVGKAGMRLDVSITISPIKDASGEVIGASTIDRNITERKRAEDLRKSAEQLRTILDATPFPIALVDTQDNNINYWSKSAITQFGHTAPTVPEWYQIAYPDPAYRNKVVERWKPALEKAQLSDHAVNTGEYRVTCKDGSVRNCELYASFLEDQLIVTFNDITERKQAEERYRLVFEYSGTANALFDTECRVILQNSLSKKMTEPMDALGKTALEVFGPEQGRVVTERMRRVLTSGKPETFETKFVLPVGTKWIYSAYQPLLNQQNAISGVQVISQDITERKQAEEALGESEKRTKVLLNALPDMMFHLDRNGVFLDYKAEKGTLYSESEDIIGKRNRDITPPEFADLIEHYINATLTTGEMQVFNYQLPVSDHGLRDYEARMVASGTDDVIAIVRDITERKQGETELVLANKELAYQNEEKEKRAAELVLANKELARRLQNIQALQKIDQAIAGSLDLNLTLNVILEHVKTQLNIDAVAVLLLNPYTQILEFTSGLGFHSKAIERSRLRLGEGHSGRAALERRTVSATDLLENSTQFDRATLLADEGFATYFGTPLIAKGQVNGVLEIYYRLPFAPDENWLEFFKILAGQAAIAVDSARLFTDLIHSNAELFAAYDSTIEGWSHALDLRDKETEGHTQRVTELTVKLARTAGITEEELVHVRRGALLHDIGKMGVPDHILLKPDKLTDEEWVAMRKHPGFALDLLSPIAYLRPAMDIPYCHHEKWDGSGYPRGLKGEQIPLTARLFAIVDVWDALRSDRPYRQSWSKEKVIEHIKSLSGTHFEPNAVDLFVNMMNEDEKSAG